MERVSVVIPTYNRPGFLREAVDSVMRQSFSNWECLISDDGSSEPADGVFEELEALDSRIHVLRGRHSGLLGQVRNRALRRATGAFVAFLDDDDTWREEKLEAQLRLMESEPRIALTFCRAERFGERSGLLPARRPPERPTFESLWQENFIPCSTVLLRRAILDRVGEFDERLLVAQDYDLWLRVARVAPIRYQDAMLCRYRVHAGAMSGMRAQEASALEEIYERLGERWNLSLGLRRSARRRVARFRTRHRHSPPPESGLSPGAGG